jgi:hypothetical protein
MVVLWTMAPTIEKQTKRKKRKKKKKKKECWRHELKFHNTIVVNSKFTKPPSNLPSSIGLGGLQGSGEDQNKGV